MSFFVRFKKRLIIAGIFTFISALGLFFASYYIGIKAQSMFYSKLDELSKYGIISITMSDYDRGLFKANAEVNGLLNNKDTYVLKSEISYSLLSFIFGVDSKNKLSLNLQNSFSGVDEGKNITILINLKSYISGTSEVFIEIPKTYSKFFTMSQGANIKSIIQDKDIKIIDFVIKDLNIKTNEGQVNLSGLNISLNGDFDSTLFFNNKKNGDFKINIDKILPDVVEARATSISYKNIIDEIVFDDVFFLSRQMKKRELINLGYDFKISKIGFLNSNTRVYPLKDFHVSMMFKNLDLNAFLDTSLNSNLDTKMSKVALLDKGFEAILEKASVKNSNSLGAFLKFRLLIPKSNDESQNIIERLKFDGKIGIDGGVTEFTKVFEPFLTHKEYVFIDMFDKFLKNSKVFDKNGNEWISSFKFDKVKNDIVFGSSEYELKNILF